MTSACNLGVMRTTNRGCTRNGAGVLPPPPTNKESVMDFDKDFLLIALREDNKIDLGMDVSEDFVEKLVDYALKDEEIHQRLLASAQFVNLVMQRIYKRKPVSFEKH